MLFCAYLLLIVICSAVTQLTRQAQCVRWLTTLGDIRSKPKHLPPGSCWGYRSLWLRVDLANGPALALYTSLGYRVAATSGWPWRRQNLMSKDLAPPPRGPCSSGGAAASTKTAAGSGNPRDQQTQQRSFSVLNGSPEKAIQSSSGSGRPKASSAAGGTGDESQADGRDGKSQNIFIWGSEFADDET